MPKRTIRSSKSNVGPPSKASNFGGLLKAYRLRSGYSQEYLAEKARVSAETIGALERGVRRAPYTDTLNLLMIALELSADDRLAMETAAGVARAQLTDQKRQKLGSADNLPLQLTPLIGRERDVARVCTLIAEHRLVTVTGPNGVGKTRVVLEVATLHARSGTDEVCFVDLAALNTSASIISGIWSALGAMRTSYSIRELGEALKTRRLLLLLDGCEHVISDVAAIALHLLGTCPELRILLASSERIGVVGETLFRLPALSSPDHIPASFDEARKYSALVLFLERSQSESSFEIEDLQKIVEICRRLDGIPRAIEVAATRVAALGLENLNLRLNERYVLAGGGRDLPVRKQMLQEEIGLSYDRLTAAEQALFRRLSIFPASHTLEDAEAVCVDETVTQARVAAVLDSLVRKSLIAVVHSGDTTQYRLSQFVRSYGLGKLAESGELEDVYKRYTQQFPAIGDQADLERS